MAIRNIFRQLTKTFVGLIGFIAIVALSFLGISGTERTVAGHFSGLYIAAEHDISIQLQTPPFAPQPSPMPTPTPASNIFATQPLPEYDEPEAPEDIVDSMSRVQIIPGESSGDYHVVLLDFVDMQLRFDVAADIDVNPENLTHNLANLLFSSNTGGYNMPMWLCIGLEIYFSAREQTQETNEAQVPNEVQQTIDVQQASEAQLLNEIQQASEAQLLNEIQQANEPAFLTRDQLALMLNATEGTAPFGDAWLIPEMKPSDSLFGLNDISYSLVRGWSDAQLLAEFVQLAQTDIHSFRLRFGEYVNALTNSNQHQWLILYQGSNLKVLTNQGSYIFVCDGHRWTWPRVDSFVQYMDSATEFIRKYFHITNTDSIRVNLYPFGVINIPASIAEIADAFGWDASDVNFVAYDEITLAGTSSHGTWAMSHEVAHLLLFREFPHYHPHTWLVEGMAVLGELLFRDSFEGYMNYRFTVPTLANINTLARNATGHSLPLYYGEYTFGNYRWTYDQVGSFMLYLYNRFGIEALLELYQSDNYSQFEIAYDLFSISLADLINSWRGFLWPEGEPEGWW